jgi:hypothetical protein
MAANALRAVRDQVEQGWSQGADARDADGAAVGLGDEKARSWSVLGAFALAAANGTPTDRIAPALRAFLEVTQANSLVDWNDFPHRTQQEVLDAFDAAIARIEGDREQD